MIYLMNLMPAMLPHEAAANSVQMQNTGKQLKQLWKYNRKIFFVSAIKIGKNTFSILYINTLTI